MLLALGDGQVNDMEQGRRFDFPKGSIVAFDKGYVDYQWFNSLTNNEVFFVTRLRAKAVLTVNERRSVAANSAITGAPSAGDALPPPPPKSRQKQHPSPQKNHLSRIQTACREHRGLAPDDKVTGTPSANPMLATSVNLSYQ